MDTLSPWRSPSPAPTTSSSVRHSLFSDGGPDPLRPFTFGRTPSLRLEIPGGGGPHERDDRSSTSPRPPFTRHLSHPGSSSRSAGSHSAAAAPLPFSFAPTPAPARPRPRPRRDTATSTQSKHEPRLPVAPYEPPIPLEIHQLLLTTPHPPPSPAPEPTPPVPPREPARRDDATRTGHGDREKGDRAASTGFRGTLRAMRTRRIRFAKDDSDDDNLATRLDHEGGSSSSENERARPPSVDVVRAWREFEAAYATVRFSPQVSLDPVESATLIFAFAWQGQFDIEEPPFPPLHSRVVVHPSLSPTAASRASQSPYDLSHFPAPLHLSRLTPIRERLVAALDLLGHFLPSEVPPHLAASSFTPSPTVSNASAPYSVASSASTRRDSLLQQSINGNADTRETTTTPSTQYSHNRSRTKSEGVASVSSTSVRSIVNHPALVALVENLVSNGLGTPSSTPSCAATVTLFPSSPQATCLTLLASCGLSLERTSFPIEVAVDAHVVANGAKGLVVGDLERDWRWRGNKDVEEKGIRFYAGMPIFAPSSLSLQYPTSTFSVAEFEEQAGGSRVAIGVLAIMDDRPKDRRDFGSAERVRLRSLASEVTSVIQQFVLDRAVALVSSLNSSAQGSTSAPHPTGPLPPPPRAHPAKARSTSSGPFPGPSAARASSRNQTRSERLPHQGHCKKVSFDAAKRSNPLETNPFPSATVDPPPSTFADPDLVPDLFHQHSPQHLLNLACASVAKNLDLSLVYLVELGDLPPSLPLDEEPSMRRESYATASSPFPHRPTLDLVASYGLPSDPAISSSSSLSSSRRLPLAASFDPALHLRALRAPEGGLLYRATSTKEPYDSGMLLPVLELDPTLATSRGPGSSEPELARSTSPRPTLDGTRDEDEELGGLSTTTTTLPRKGWVLAGYAKQRGRKWGSDEMDVFEKVSHGVAKILLWREECQL
ncbi:hypothetical protein JCM10212_005787 [Sporobolomyces blumeae]